VEKTGKILIFSTAYYPFVGGAEVAIKEITDRISDLQFDLLTARFDKNLPKFEKIGNVNIYRIGFGIPILDKLFLPFWGAIFALRLNQKNHYNYFWCMMVTFGSGAAYIANILHFWKKVPIILTLQEGDSESHLTHRWLGTINLSWKLALRKTSIITAISSYLVKRAKRLGYKKEIKIIPNGVDAKYFSDFSKQVSENGETKKILRAKIGFNDQDVILVTTSRLTTKNGIDLVIEALKFLPQNYKFIIIGSGPEEDILRAQAEKIETNNGSTRVKFLGFQIGGSLPAYLGASDIFIRPSRDEGFGNSFIEAMACKLPVIATPVGGIVDFLFDPNLSFQTIFGEKNIQTGYLCLIGNPKSIADTVQRVINDPNKNQVIENAYNMVLRKYDWSLIANKMKEVFCGINNGEKIK